jgi:hypothetical protein
MLNYPPEMLIKRKGKDVCGEMSMGEGEGGGCVCIGNDRTDGVITLNTKHETKPNEN